MVYQSRKTGEDCSGCSKWPSSKAAGELKPEAYPRGYVEDFDEPRTKLADFFSILLEIRLDARRRLIEDRCGGAREGFVVHVVEGIDAELDQAGRQKVEEFF
jgi:hypothetical protein